LYLERTELDGINESDGGLWSP